GRRLAAYWSASSSRPAHVRLSLTGTAAHSRKTRPLGAKGSALPELTKSCTRTRLSFTTRSPLRWSQLAKKAPSRRRQGKPIMVERVPPACSRSGLAYDQNRVSRAAFWGDLICLLSRPPRAPAHL